MPMAEASVDEYDLPQPGKHKIWSAGKIRSVKPETVSQAVCCPSDRQLRFSVYPADAPHVRAAILG